MSVQSVSTKWGDFTPPMLRLVKDGYEKAVAEGAEEFEVQGQTLLTQFAKYLIEFLEGQGLVAS